MGVCTSDPIHIHLTQSSVKPPTPTHIPISHLVPDHGQKPILSLVQRPNPLQLNALPMIGGSSYANQAAQQPRQSPSAPHQPARQVTSPMPKPTLTEAQLCTRMTTKAVIVQNAQDTFNAQLPITKTKTKLIQSYLNLIENHGMPNVMTTTSPQAPTSSATKLTPRPCKVTSDWNIHCLPGTKTIEFQKPFNGNAYSMVKAIETCLRQAIGEASPPITILVGRWWSTLSSNFTLTLAGNPSVNLV
jgi:hypothetical protein